MNNNPLDSQTIEMNSPKQIELTINLMNVLVIKPRKEPKAALNALWPLF